MSAPTPEQLAKLPRWARSRIEVLERNVEFWKAKAGVGGPPSDTWAGSYYDEDPRPLGKGERVTFKLDDGLAFEARLVAERRLLQVNVTGRLGYSMAVVPHSSNVALIIPVEDR